MPSYGIPGSATYSITFDSLDAMLASVPDNNVQAIGATAVRDSIFTLWDRISTYSWTASMGPQGWQGVQGFQGWQGEGVQGVQGVQGRQGYQGVQGSQGFQGI
jgi:hypothetical protein